MSIDVTADDLARLRRIIRRPRSRKQLYRAEALLALGEGMSLEAVARKCRVGVDRVEDWVERFQKARFKFLAEPDAVRPKVEENRPPQGEEWLDEE